MCHEGRTRQFPAGVRALLTVACLLGFTPAFAAQTIATTTALSITVAGKAASTASSGVPVTLTATVTAGSAAATAGTVNFCDAAASICSDIHLLGSTTVSSGGTASIIILPPPGMHRYKADYLGVYTDATNDGNASSSSAAASFAVSAPTTTSLAQSGGAGNYTLTATVSGPGPAPAPTGTVSFQDTSNNNVVLGSASLIAGAAGSVTWSTSQSPAVEPEPQSVVVADFNGDGIPDLAVGTAVVPSGTGSSGSLSILLGNGDGTFQAAKNFATAASNSALVAGAFVTGGPLDVISITSGASSNYAQLLIGDGKGGGTLGTPPNFGGGSGHVVAGSVILAGDFNHDGSLDLVLNGVAYGASVFMTVPGNGDGTFPTPTLNAVADDVTALAVGDFRNTGSLDLIVASGSGGIDFWQNNSGFGEIVFTPGNPITGAPTSTSAMAAGDFNGDGKLDLAVVDQGSGSVFIFLGDGTGSFAASSTSTVGASPTGIAVGDFNADGVADLAVVNSADATVTILIGKGDGTFSVGATLTTGTDPASLAVGNFSASALPGVAVANVNSANPITGTLTVFSSLLEQTATATSAGIAPAAAGPHLVDAAYPGTATYAGSHSSTTTLSGSGSASAPLASLSVNSLNFAAQNIGSSSATQSVMLTNSGQGALTITTIAASAGFQQSNTCGNTLAAGASCSILVSFAPTASGAVNGTLTITDNATSSPQTATLTGIGASVGLSAGTSSLSVTSPGGTTSTLITLASQGGFSGTVNLTCAVTYQGTGVATNPPTCLLTPSQVQVSATTPGTSTLKVSTAGPSTAFIHNSLRNSGMTFAALLVLVMVPRRKKTLLTLIVSAAVAAGASGCSSGGGSSAGSSAGSSPTTTGSYSVVVTATSATVNMTLTFPLTVQ